MLLKDLANSHQAFKYSQNWKKQQRRIAQLDIRIANCRHDFLHQLSTETSKNHAVICIENLQVKNMSRSARGTVEEPGSNVAAKSGLNKAILDQGWGTFRRMLEYKQLWRGGEVIAVPPRYTSQECPKETRQNNLAIFPINVVCWALCRTQVHRPSQRSLPS